MYGDRQYIHVPSLGLKSYREINDQEYIDIVRHRKFSEVDDLDSRGVNLSENPQIKELRSHSNGDRDEVEPMQFGYRLDEDIPFK